MDGIHVICDRIFVSMDEIYPMRDGVNPVLDEIHPIRDRFHVCMDGIHAGSVRSHDLGSDTHPILRRMHAIAGHASRVIRFKARSRHSPLRPSIGFVADRVTSQVRPAPTPRRLR